MSSFFLIVVSFQAASASCLLYVTGIIAKFINLFAKIQGFETSSNATCNVRLKIKILLAF